MDAELNRYLPMFLAEGREHLQELNLAVVRLEEHPGERATVDAIFRIAHSLKGMSATMGFAEMAGLTHAMEDVFELLRQRGDGLSGEAVDVLLECLDALARMIDAIEADGREPIVPVALVGRLHELVRERADEPEDSHVVRVDVELAADAQMPAVRAYMVLTALAEQGELTASDPELEHVDGFAGGAITAWVATTGPAKALAAAALTVPEVAIAHAAPQAPPADAEPAAPAAAAEPAAAPRRAAAATVRVDADRLDQLMHHMGELILHRTHVEGLAAQAAVPGMAQAMQNLTRTSHALQQLVMQVRMIPVDAVFVRMPRLVRDLSTQLGKRVELHLAGRDTELDRTVVDALGDPLVHLVRNALDHGLEPPAERTAAGKPEVGTLEISARHAGGNVIISVRDDGRGIDPAAVARKAVQRGLLAAADVDAVDACAAVELLFSPGFSTAETTSDLSGRGVGMDAVRTVVRGLGGDVLMHSEPGVGTTAQIRLPLTLAITAALLVEIGAEPYAVPVDRIDRTVRLADHPIRSVAGTDVLVLGDGVVPLVDGAARLACGAGGAAADHGVVVRTAGTRVVLAVGRLVGQRELVCRPLPPEVFDDSGLSGGAVLADGRIALIVDCDALGEGASPRIPSPALAA